MAKEYTTNKGIKNGKTNQQNTLMRKKKIENTLKIKARRTQRIKVKNVKRSEDESNGTPPSAREDHTGPAGCRVVAWGKTAQKNKKMATPDSCELLQESQDQNQTEAEVFVERPGPSVEKCGPNPPKSSFKTSNVSKRSERKPQRAYEEKKERKKINKQCQHWPTSLPASGGLVGPWKHPTSLRSRPRLVHAV